MSRLGAIEPIPEVAQPGHDPPAQNTLDLSIRVPLVIGTKWIDICIPLLIQIAIDRRRDDVQLRELLRDHVQPVHGRDDVHEDDVRLGHALLLEEGDGFGGRAAGGEHRFEEEDNYKE